MKRKPEKENETREPDDRGEPFFRELQIEFLIHELKDPVSVVETGVRALLEKKEKYGELSPRQERTLVRLLRNAKKTRDMLNDLLEIGRSEAGCFLCCRFQPAEVAGEVVLETLEMADAGLHDRFRPDAMDILSFLGQCGIHIHIAPPVLDAEMFQDRVKFRQIVGNLVKNALHHRRESVEIHLDRESDKFCLEISDDGPGVGAEHHQTIFCRYAQVDPLPSMPRQGHGLGLAGARALARRLGGDIEVRSARGQGATFRLTLPFTIGELHGADG